jgi:hypothetical protein
MFYDKIAAAIVLTQERINTSNGAWMTQQMKEAQLRGVRRAAAHLTDALKDEPGFDPTRFLSACGYGASIQGAVPIEQLPEMQAQTRANDHATSKAAAKAIDKVSGKIALAVLSYARQNPQGFIDDDLKVAFSNAPESSYRKRRSELTNRGYLEPKMGLGLPMTRKNRNGRDETVWFITDKGRTVV